MTVRDLIEKAFKTIKVLGASEHLDSEEIADAFDALNGIIEQVSIDKLMGSYQTQVTVPMVSDQFIYTIGPVSSSPHVTAPRPVEILSGFSRRSGTDTPLTVGAKQDYDSIAKKDVKVAAWIQFVYYEAAFPKGSIYVYPVPADTLTTVYLTVMNELVSFATIDDVVSLPPGYRVWLQYKLGQRMAPEYGMVFTEAMSFNLLEVEETLKKNNIKPLPMISAGIPNGGSGGAYNVHSDRSRS
jgi:hypothetical protein